MKRKPIVISGIFTVIIVALCILFTPLAGSPKLIFLETNGEGKHIRNVDDIKEVNLFIYRNYSYFVNNLKYCNNLTDLIYDYNECPYLDVNSLSETDLKKLHILNNQWKNEYIKLEKLDELAFISSDYCDCEYFKYLTNLEFLSIGFKTIDNLKKLSELHNLKRLEIYTSKLKMESLENVTELFIDSLEIQDVQQISSMKNLESIYISNEVSGEISLEYFSQLPNLKKLTLVNCKFQESEEEIEKYREYYNSKLEEVYIKEFEE